MWKTSQWQDACGELHCRDLQSCNVAVTTSLLGPKLRFWLSFCMNDFNNIASFNANIRIFISLYDQIRNWTKALKSWHVSKQISVQSWDSLLLSPKSGGHVRCGLAKLFQITTGSEIHSHCYVKERKQKCTHRYQICTHEKLEQWRKQDELHCSAFLVLPRLPCEDMEVKLNCGAHLGKQSNRAKDQGCGSRNMAAPEHNNFSK